MFRRMHFGEDGKEVAVERSGIGHAGIAEQQRKNGGQRNPQHHPGDEVRGAASVEPLDEKAGDERSVLRFAPGNNSQKAGLQSQIDGGDSENRKKDAAGNIFFRIANLSAQVANVVVAPIAVDGVDHGRAKAGEPQRGKMERAGRKIEGEARTKVPKAAPNQPE